MPNKITTFLADLLGTRSTSVSSNGSNCDVNDKANGDGSTRRSTASNGNGSTRSTASNDNGSNGSQSSPTFSATSVQQEKGPSVDEDEYEGHEKEGHEQGNDTNRDPESPESTQLPPRAPRAPTSTTFKHAPHDVRAPEYIAALDALIDAYLKDKFVKIPGLPTDSERRFYRTMIDIFTTSLQTCMNDLAIDFMSHRFRFVVRQGFAEKLCSINKCHTNKHNKKKREDLHLTRAIVSVLVDRYIDSQGVAVDSHVNLLPIYAERRLFINITYTLMCMIQDSMQVSSLDLFGQRMVIAFLPQDQNREPSLSIIGRSLEQRRFASSRPTCVNKGDEKDGRSRFSGEASTRAAHAAQARRLLQGRRRTRSASGNQEFDYIDRIVDRFMATQTEFQIPDYLERHLYKKATRVILGVMQEVVSSSNINMFNQTFGIQFEKIPDLTHNNSCGLPSVFEGDVVERNSASEDILNALLSGTA